MKAIFRREIRSYLHGITGYVFISVYLLFAAIFVFLYNFIYLNPSIAYVLSDLSLILAILVPVLTMKAMSDEQRGGAYRLLYSLPLKSSQIVMGKYMALVALFAIPAAVTALFPLLFDFFGNVNYISSYGAIAAFFLYGAALIAICMFISSLTDNTVVCAVVSYIVILILYFSNILIGLLTSSEIAHEAVSIFSLFGGLEKFIYGIIDIRAIVYYILVSAVFIFLTVRSVERKRLA